MDWSWTIGDLRDAVADGRASAAEICQAYLDRIGAYDESLHAFTTVARDDARERAAALDALAPAARRPLRLAGVPLAAKENICTRGLRSSAGSRMLDTFVPPYSATVIRRLEDAGAVILGKTNCDEFAMGSSTEYSAHGPSRNPWDPDRTPGGSSGGSAVAVAARLVPGALGSDTGGSVRQPAALCGVVGVKPTYGRVSRYGLIAFASSLDQIGPFGRTVRDAAILLSVIAGRDPADSTSAAEPVPDFEAALTGRLESVRIGVPRSLLADGVDAGVLDAFWAAVRTLESRGAIVADVELRTTPLAIPVYYLIATAEASSNLARYDGVRYGYRARLDGTDATLAAMYDRTRGEGFGSEVKRRIMLGTYVLSAGYYDAYYLKAQQVRTLIRRDYEEALSRVHAIALPTSPVPAFRLGERMQDPLQMYLADIFTVGPSLAGLPAVSVPCGFAGGLPVGLQLTGRAFEEELLLRVADAYERETGWWRRLPGENGAAATIA